jgi:MraZ protein
MQEESFYLGEFTHTVDSQGRVAIPRDWRCSNGETRLVMLPGPANDLLLYPRTAFMEFIRNARRKAFTNRKIRDILALVGSRARECTCDKQGRIKLPLKRLEELGMSERVTMIGAFTYIKLCSEATWKSQQQTAGELDELAEIEFGDSGDLAAALQSIMENKPEK